MLFYYFTTLKKTMSQNTQTTNRKTKIVATIGPGSESKENFAKLLKVGVDVARTNMSHDDQTIHQARIENIRAVSQEEHIPVAILLDLSGPKIRIGDFEDVSVELIPGAEFILSGTKVVGNVRKVYFNYPNIEQDIKPGQILMVDDGRRKLRVDKLEGTDIYTTVLVGGVIKSRRGVNIPNAYLSISAITDKDKNDLEFAVKMGVDYIALSFVRTAKDIEELRGLIKSHGGNQPIAAKIETPESVEKIDEIIAAADMIMVARGDLAVEIGHAKVPAVQKMLIEKCNAAGKPVIVATQMLESMIKAPVPTRAEVSDIANAVYAGADAVMLSEESSLGEFAVEAVTMMREVIEETEKDMKK
jgi:pyruvate kinase